MNLSRSELQTCTEHDETENLIARLRDEEVRARALGFEKTADAMLEFIEELSCSQGD